jgi:hypothetical protein
MMGSPLVHQSLTNFRQTPVARSIRKGPTMNINTISHPALATPVSPLPQAGASARKTQAPHPFAKLMQQAHQATGGRSVPSHLSAESRAFSAQAAMNHAQ